MNSARTELEISTELSLAGQVELLALRGVSTAQSGATFWVKRAPG